jgi:hypothetical protein
MFPRFANDGRIVEPGATITPGTHYHCSTNVTAGDSVTLEARPSPRFEFVGWKGFFGGDYCPCEATKSTTCKIEVNPDVISRYGRAYCGAIWKLRRGGQIAR